LALAQIGEFSFVLAKEAFNKRLLPAEVFHPLVASSVFTLLASPYLIGLAPRVASWVDRRTGRRAGVLEVTEPAAERPRVILVGYGPAGQRVGEALLNRRIPFTVLDLNPLTVAVAGDRIRIALGDATQEEILIHAGVRTADAVVVTTPDPAATRTILRQVKALAPGVQVIARARYHIYAQPLRHQGASVVVDEEEGVGQLLADQTLQFLVKPVERETA
jgi:CPA2 family monovalent cation:H+ antiporter-2